MRTMLLFIAALLISFFGFKAMLNAQYKRCYQSAYNGFDDEGIIKPQSDVPVRFEQQPTSYPAATPQNYGNDFCRQCCAQGRWVSDECARNCNACDAYSDFGKAESKDIPGM